MPSTPSPDSSADYLRQRARFLRHVVDDGQFTGPDAEELISEWERQASRVRRSRGSTSYWREAWLWIGRQVAGDAAAPKRDMNAKAADGQVYGG